MQVIEAAHKLAKNGGGTYAGKPICDRKNKSEMGQKLFGFISILTDAYEKLRDSGCYCELDEDKICIPNTVEHHLDCAHNDLFLLVQQFYVMAIKAFQQLDLGSFDVINAKHVFDSAMAVASESSASIRTAIESMDGGKKAKLIDDIGRVFKEGLGHLDAVEWDQVTDAVQLVTSISAKIYAYTKDTLKDTLHERDEARQSIKTVNNVATAVSVVSSIVGACAGEPSAIIFLAGEAVSQAGDAVDRHQELKWWLDTFATALEKDLKAIKAELIASFGQGHDGPMRLFRGYVSNGFKCGKKDIPKTFKGDRDAFVFYYHMTKEQMKSACDKHDVWLWDDEHCRVCKGLPFCQGQTRKTWKGSVCDCVIDETKAARFIAKGKSLAAKAG